MRYSEGSQEEGTRRGLEGPDRVVSTLQYVCRNRGEKHPAKLQEPQVYPVWWRSPDDRV